MSGGSAPDSGRARAILATESESLLHPPRECTTPVPGERTRRPRESVSTYLPLPEVVDGTRSLVGLSEALSQPDHSNNSQVADGIVYLALHILRMKTWSLNEAGYRLDEAARNIAAQYTS